MTTAQPTDTTSPPVRVIYIRRIDTNEIVDTFDVSRQNERSIRKIIDGLDYNMNHDEYWIDSSSALKDEPEEA